MNRTSKRRTGRHLPKATGSPAGTVDQPPGRFKVGGIRAESRHMLSTQVVQEPSIGSLTYDDEIRDCTLDEVCVVRVGDRVLVLPIDAELAAMSGFEVIEIDAAHLTSIGVKPRASRSHHLAAEEVSTGSVTGAAKGAAAAAESAEGEHSNSATTAVSDVPGNTLTRPNTPGNHPLHQENGKLIGTLDGQIPTEPDPDRRTPNRWAEALQDTFLTAPSTATAETLPGTMSSTPTNGVPPVHSPISAKLVDWSVLDAVVEPARPLDVASASREDGLGLSHVGWPEIDRRAPEILETAPAAFNPFAAQIATAQPANRSGDLSTSATIPTSNPSFPSNLTSNGLQSRPTATDPVVNRSETQIAAVASNPVVSTGSTGSMTGHAGLGASPHFPLTARASEGTATFASVVASQLVISGSSTREGALGISFVLAPGEAMEIRDADNADGPAEILQLFRTLAGFVAPASGSLDVDAEDRSSLASSERARREALFSGSLFDSAVLIPEESAAANLEIPLLAAGIAPATASAMTASRIETMGLSVLGPHRVDSLSSDLRVLVGVARSLIMPSPLIVIAMDTGPLAGETVKWLHALVDQARRGGAAIVYRSSDPRFHFDGRRTAVLRNGSLEPLSVFADPSEH